MVRQISDWVEQVEEMGYHLVRLRPRSKQPPKGYPLAEHLNGDVSAADPHSFQPNDNCGLVTGEIIDVEFDENIEAARTFFAMLRAILKTIFLSRRGPHILFQSPYPNFPTGKFAYGDVKATGGYVVFPFSTVMDTKTRTSWTYTFLEKHPLVPKSELPVFDPNMLNMLNGTMDVNTSKMPATTSGRVRTRGVIRDAIAYVTKKVESVQGQHGSNGLIRAISILRDSGMTEAEATVVMIDWNNSGKAVPPWSLQELTRAISRTYAKANT